MLWVEDIAKSFGGLEVLKGCSLKVGDQEIVGLIGPNGAGKTTLFDIIAGDLLPDAGEVKLDGTALHHRPSFQRARLGLVRTFQIPKLFESMPVMENLMVAAPQQLGESLGALWWRGSAIREQEEQIEQRAWRILEFLKCAHLANELAGSVSGGQKKLLELGRALMLDPSVILLDEPVAGVNPVLAEEIAAHIRDLRAQGRTFLIIGHNMDFMMKLCDRMYVLAFGAMLVEGTPDEVRSDPRVIEAYLGGE